MPGSEPLTRGAGSGRKPAHMIPEDDKEPVAAVEEEVPDAAATAEDPYAELEADVMKWRELAVRTAADLDNFRKRSAREREDAIRYANQGLLEDLLPVIDNFEMGMLAAAQDKSSMIYIGMDMVRRQLNDFLSAQGVTEIPAEGRMFDPNVHEAISQEDSSPADDGKVLRVNRRGFMLRDRLLRPATVVVARSAPETDGEEG
jgi:molecular chaperone GrpE